MIEEDRPLSLSLGAVLDPIFSLRRTVRIPPGGVAKFCFSTGVAKSREEASMLIDRVTITIFLLVSECLDRILSQASAFEYEHEPTHTFNVWQGEYTLRIHHFVQVLNRFQKTADFKQHCGPTALAAICRSS